MPFTVLSQAEAERLGRALHAVIWRSGNGHLVIHRERNGNWRCTGSAHHQDIYTHDTRIEHALEKLFERLEGRFVP
jgi:hypothetical protein